MENRLLIRRLPGRTTDLRSTHKFDLNFDSSIHRVPRILGKINVFRGLFITQMRAIVRRDTGARDTFFTFNDFFIATLKASRAFPRAGR